MLNMLCNYVKCLQFTYLYFIGCNNNYYLLVFRYYQNDVGIISLILTVFT